MCLGVPGQVTEIWLSSESGLPLARVDFGGIRKEICLSFTPEVQVGDYVIVHVGFAISQIDEAEATQALALLADMGQLVEIG